MKLHVVDRDGRVYVSPYSDTIAVSEFCRCMSDVFFGKVKVFRMFHGNGEVTDNYRFDYEAYINAGMSEEEIMRMETLIDAAARMVFDPRESDSMNAWNIAAAIKGVLGQEGLA